jgi:hypothetical protein
VTLGLVLDLPEAMVLAAAMTAQDPYILPKRAQNPDLHEYLDLMTKVQRSRDYYSKGLGSDPLGLLFLYCDWIRLDNSDERRRRSSRDDPRKAFCMAHGLVYSRMRTLDAVVRAITMAFSRGESRVVTYEQLRQRLAALDAERDILTPRRLSLIRGLLLGAFPNHLILGVMKGKKAKTGKDGRKKAEDPATARSLKIGGYPPFLSKKDQLQQALKSVGTIEEVAPNHGGGIKVVFAKTKAGEHFGKCGDEEEEGPFAPDDPLGELGRDCVRKVSI